MPCVNWKNDLTENLIWNHGLSQSIRLQNWGNLFFPGPLLRLLLSSLAYVLMEAIRRQALKGTKLANAQMTTIRLKLLKIGAVILRNTRRVCFLLSSAYPPLPAMESEAKAGRPQ